MRSRVVIDLDLQVVYDILVRSPGTEPGAPDVSHLYSSGAAILPGTSLAGVMRTQALRIAKLVRHQKDDAERWIDRLFGPRFDGQRPPPDHKLCASRLRIGEARLERSQSRRQTRVALDRFTQGAVDTALFDEQTEVGGRATGRLELRNPQDGELGVVLLVVKDLLDGMLPVGGSSSVGRGVLRGSATVTWHDGSGGLDSTTRSARVELGKSPTGNAATEIDRAIQAFHEAALLPEKQSGAGQAVNTGDCV
jgi:CRISPR/Cas system CSM-associated protein Csm3 (group 7 of RAMP superfamily)